MRKFKVYINKERTKTGIAIAKLPAPEKGHKYIIKPITDGYYTKVYIIDVII
jgi:hypothetical protein